MISKLVTDAHHHQARAERLTEAIAALQAPSTWAHHEPSRAKRHEIYLEQRHEIALAEYQRRGGYPSRSAALRALIEESCR